MAATVAMRPREPSSAAHQLCSQIFPSSALKSDQSKFTYSTGDDFGKKIQKLLFCKPKEGFSSHFFANVKEIGLIEGFNVIPSETVHCCRDARLRASDGAILSPAWHENVFKAIGHSEKRSKFMQDHCCVLTDHPSFEGIHAGAVALQKMNDFTSECATGQKLRASRLYFEAGNCFRLTNKNGVQRFVIGEELGIVTHQLLRKNRWFCKQEENSENSWTEACVFAKYNDQITQRYLRGGVVNTVTRIATEYSNSLSEEQALGILEEMKQMQLFESLDFDPNKNEIKGRALASEYMAEMKFVLQELFPAELRCEPDQLFFSPQIAYHLDLAMAPGPKGSIFLVDYQESVRLLQTVLEEAEKLGLSQKDKEHLVSFIQTTGRLGQDLKPLFGETKERWEERGFRVIPVPAGFYSYLDGKPFNINFLNIVTGYSEKTGHYYVIAPGTKTKGKLAEILMDCFVESVRSHCDNVQVYFVGRNPNDERDFSEAVETMNGERQQLGPHCLSFELMTSPHTTP